MVVEPGRRSTLAVDRRVDCALLQQCLVSPDRRSQPASSIPNISVLEQV